MSTTHDLAGHASTIWQALLELLKELVCDCRPRAVWNLGPFVELDSPPAKTPQFYRPTDPHAEISIMFTMTDSQFTTITAPATAKDKRGNPIDLSGKTYAYSTDNPDVLALTPAADGKSCVAAAVTPLGVAGVTMKADDNSITLTGQVTVIAGTPVSADIVFAPPAEQP